MTEITSNNQSTVGLDSGDPFITLFLNETAGQVVPTRDERLAVIEVSTLSAILLLAVTSNLTMLIALIRQRTNRPLSRMYFFMMHLSLADLLVSIFNILPQLAWDITFRFYGGDVLCRFVKYAQVMTLYLSTYILMFMAVDRYRAVTVRNNLHWNSLKVAKGFVAASWIMALLFAIPQAVIFGEKEVTPGGATDCWVQFVEPWGAKAYVTWFVVSIFGAPLLVIIVCYGVICRQIWIYSQSAVLSAPTQTSNTNGGAPGSSIAVTSNHPTHPAGSRPTDASCANILTHPVSFLRRWFLLASLRWRSRAARSSAQASAASASSHSKHNGTDNSKSAGHQQNNSTPHHPSSSHSGSASETAGHHQMVTLRVSAPTPSILGASMSGGGGTMSTRLTTTTTTTPQCCHNLPQLRRSNSSRITKAKMKTIKLTLVVVICFVACWAPFCIAQLVMVYSPPSSQTDISSAVVIILLLASLNSCTNPWVYLAFSGSLLNQMRSCLGLAWLRGKDNDSIGEDDRRGATGPQQQPGGVLTSAPRQLPNQERWRPGANNRLNSPPVVVRMTPKSASFGADEPEHHVSMTGPHSDSKLMGPSPGYQHKQSKKRSTLSLNLSASAKSYV